MRTILFLILAVVILAIARPPAEARRSKDNTASAGSASIMAACPAGTCNRRGGTRARDVKYCSAANCRK